MKKADVTKFIKNTQETLSNHSPAILTAIGIGGMFTAMVLVADATPKALKRIEEKKEEEGTDELTVLETVQAGWKPYIPAAVTALLSAGCLIGANSVNAKRNAALATAYKISETAFSEYRTKVVETIGEKKEKTVREKVNQDRVDRDPVSKSQVFVTDKGNTICYDYHSGRYFKSDYAALKRAENKINRKLINEMYASLNDLYSELGLSHTKQGDDLGWRSDDGFLEIEITTQLTDDDQPCLVMDYNIDPKRGYSKLKR